MLRLAFPFALLWSSGVQAAPSIEGVWRTHDRKALVTIAPCGKRMCGTTTQVLDKAADLPKTDVNNPDPALRNRPILGMQVLSGFKREGEIWKGEAYDPKSGRSYRSTLQLNPNGSLKVTGCVLFGCKSKRWKRAR